MFPTPATMLPHDPGRTLLTLEQQASLTNFKAFRQSASKFMADSMAKRPEGYVPDHEFNGRLGFAKWLKVQRLINDYAGIRLDTDWSDIRTCCDFASALANAKPIQP